MPTIPRKPKFYLVKTPTGERLVRAFTPIGAIKHCVGTTHLASVATQDQLIAALAKSVKVENAGDSPEAGEQEELDV